MIATVVRILILWPSSAVAASFHRLFFKITEHSYLVPQLVQCIHDAVFHTATCCKNHEKKSITFGPKCTYTSVFQVEGHDQTDLLGDTCSADFITKSQTLCSTLKSHQKKRLCQQETIHNFGLIKYFHVRGKEQKSLPRDCLPFQNPPRAGGSPRGSAGLAAALFPFHECHLVGPPAPARPAPLLSQGRPGSPQVSPTGKIGRKNKRDCSWL